MLTVILLFGSLNTVFPNTALTVEASNVSFTPRTTAPASNNAYYIHTSYGGLNQCILGSNQGSYRGSALPNCVGYAWGRAYEISGKTPTLSKNNADTFWGRTSDGYARGQEARLGAVVCWSGGSAGHVAVVESINGSTITISESMWNGSYFKTRTGTIQELTSWLGFSFNFQGFIYILDNAGSTTITPPVQTTQKSYTVQSSSGSNVRNFASTSAQVVGAVAKGSVIRYTQTIVANGYIWMLVESNSTFASGTWGKTIGYWVAQTDNAESTTVTPPTQTAQKTYTIQSSSGGNVRQSASTSAQVVGAVAKGSVIRYTQTVVANGYTWMLIESESNFTGGTWGKTVGCWVAMV